MSGRKMLGTFVSPRDMSFQQRETSFLNVITAAARRPERQEKADR